MTPLLVTLVPILLVDVLNPVLFALLVFMAGSPRPVVNSTSVLLGHTLAYLLAGIPIALGLERLTERLANPERVDFVIGGVLGLLLVWAALRMRGGSAPSSDEPQWQLTPLRCFAFGAVINFFGLPFALPYLAAIDRILKADLDVVTSVTVLVVYNAAYALVFAVVPVSVALAGDAAKPLLERINGFLTRAADIAMPWMLLLLGAWLVFDAAYYFVTGRLLG